MIHFNKHPIQDIPEKWKIIIKIDKVKKEKIGPIDRCSQFYDIRESDKLIIIFDVNNRLIII